MSVTLLLDDDVDISRGDMICRPNNRPAAAQDIEAMVCWMSSDQPLARRSRLIVKHTSRTVKAIVTDLHYRIDVNTLHRDESATQLGLNEIGRVRLRLTQPIFADPYSRNRHHRRPHPHRRGHQHHRGHRHDHRGQVSRRSPTRSRKARSCPSLRPRSSC